jgi:hypothetical protein
VTTHPTATETEGPRCGGGGYALDEVGERRGWKCPGCPDCETEDSVRCEHCHDAGCHRCQTFRAPTRGVSQPEYLTVPCDTCHGLGTVSWEDKYSDRDGTKPCPSCIDGWRIG